MIEPSPLIIILSIVLTLISITEKVISNNKRLRPFLNKLIKNKQTIEESIKSGRTNTSITYNDVLKDLHDIQSGIDDMIDISSNTIVFKFPII